MNNPTPSTNKLKIQCPCCDQEMLIGLADSKVVACCENKECESVLVFGEPMQVKFGISPKEKTV